MTLRNLHYKYLSSTVSLATCRFNGEASTRIKDSRETHSVYALLLLLALSFIWEVESRVNTCWSLFMNLNEVNSSIISVFEIHDRLLCKQGFARKLIPECADVFSGLINVIIILTLFIKHSICESYNYHTIRHINIWKYCIHTCIVWPIG